MTDRPILRLVSTQSEAAKTTHCIVVGKVAGMFRVSILWGQPVPGEHLGGDFVTLGEAIRHAHELRLTHGWDVRDLTGEEYDF